eukprot:7218549-Pyramimonas_sp.AAC.1
MPESSPVVLATQGQTANYAEHVEGGHEYGRPHIWALGGALKNYAGGNPGGQIPGFNLPASLLKELCAAYEQYSEWSIEQKCDLVLHCRLEMVFRKSMKKVALQWPFATQRSAC